MPDEKSGRAPDRVGNPNYSAYRPLGFQARDTVLTPEQLERQRAIGRYQEAVEAGYDSPDSAPQAADAADAVKNKRTDAFERRRLFEQLQKSADDAVYIDGRLLQTISVRDPNTGLSYDVQVLGGFPQQEPEDYTRPIAANSTEAGDTTREFAGVVGGQTDGVQYDLQLANGEKETHTYRGTYAPVGLTTAQVGKQRAELADRNGFYSILNLDQIYNPGMAFIMNRGPKLDSSGQEAHSGNQDLRVGGRNASQNKPATVTNMMTLAQGVGWLRTLARKDPETYNELQRLLVEGKFMDEQDVRSGLFTPEAAAGFVKAGGLASMNNDAGSDEDFFQFLHRASGAAKASSTEPEFEPVVRQYVDPAELHQTARAQAEKMLGRSLSDDEVAKFAARFRGMETAMFDQIDAAKRAGGTITYTDPSASGQAEDFLRDPRYNTDRARGLMNSYMPVIQSLMQVGPGYL